MTAVMGVLNVTPDSFFDGGRWVDQEAAVERGVQMVAEGADIIDVGGESTRPGAEPVTDEEEARRVVPVVAELSQRLRGRARVSVDTRKRPVAEAALAAGASLLNDVSASLWPVAAEARCGWVAMHMRGSPSDMDRFAHYDDVVAEVKTFLSERAGLAAAAGVSEVWVDPGIGFAKTAAHNFAILARLAELVGLGWPLAIGVSRKRFTGLVALPGTEKALLSERFEGSLAAAVWAIAQGAALVRSHDVRATVGAAALAGAR